MMSFLLIDEEVMEYELLLYALLLSIGFIVLSIRWAGRLGWVDRPDDRKQHRHPVPLTGGIAMCAAFCLSLPLMPDKPDAYLVLLASLVVLALVGAYDDLRSIRPATRFLFQTVAVLLMTLNGQVLLSNLGNLLGWGSVVLGDLAIPFTLFGIVGVINAFNMIDGLDGLAGGVALIAIGWLLALNLTAPAPDHHASNALLVLAMVIVGFLCFNLRHPWRVQASVFMGDSGSTMLGFALGWFLVSLSQDREGQAAVMTPMTAVWILAVPLLDAVTVMIRRLRARQSPFNADRQHLHHLLLNYGYSDGQVTAMLLTGALITGVIGMAAHRLAVPEFVQFYGFLGVFLLYYQATTHIWLRHLVRLRQNDQESDDGQANSLTPMQR
ncbi:MAG: undecaprenyl/decaprenyl-phosphate alpha-N-acetylglucosaminyl 1-phosphate transferase [Candidatus Contendobacter sp.]|nr:undecaprenyl/decaprenyl-phosphate alpha-N-acetylglucosaminyl 1-phosphate transferase [Candidatus Contendobacter sp.]